MSEKRRSREWWRKTVSQWRQGGLPAEEFAAGAGVKTSTLRWWSSSLNRGTRAKHGAVDIRPIEIAVTDGASLRSVGTVEIAVGAIVLRFETGTDVAYVASLVRSLGS